jgi:chromosome segregation ATPase
MPNDYTAPNDYIRDYRHYIEHERPEKFLDGARLALKKLHQALDIIPRNQAHPEWIRHVDVLQQLYHQKDEAQQEAEAQARSVQHYITVLNREINRCGNNLSALQRDLQILRAQHNQITYQDSINRYAEQFRKASKQRQLAIDVLNALMAAIRESASRQFNADYELATSKDRAQNTTTAPSGHSKENDADAFEHVPSDDYTRVLGNTDLFTSKEPRHDGIRHQTKARTPGIPASDHKPRGRTGNQGTKSSMW